MPQGSCVCGDFVYEIDGAPETVVGTKDIMVVFLRVGVCSDLVVGHLSLLAMPEIQWTDGLL